jgi:uncharacterized protein YneF (UPF0154 family)
VFSSVITLLIIFILSLGFPELGGFFITNHLIMSPIYLTKIAAKIRPKIICMVIKLDPPNPIPEYSYSAFDIVAHILNLVKYFF